MMVSERVTSELIASDPRTAVHTTLKPEPDVYNLSLNSVLLMVLCVVQCLNVKM